jgi:hypothetical protein
LDGFYSGILAAALEVFAVAIDRSKTVRLHCDPSSAPQRTAAEPASRRVVPRGCIDLLFA